MGNGLFLYLFHLRIFLPLFIGKGSIKFNLRGVRGIRYSDILNQTELNVTKDQLRRYRQYGLIRNELRSYGKGSGVRAVFSERTVDSIKEIQNLNSRSFIKNVRETIFILFIKGYTVEIDILKQELKKFYLEHILGYLEKTNMRILVDQLNLSEDLRAYLKSNSLKKKVGRPTKESEETLDNKINSIIESLKQYQPLLNLFLKQNTTEITEDKLKNIGLDLKMIPFWFDNQYWVELIDNSKESDYAEILELWNCIQNYWNIIKESIKSNTTAITFIEFVEQYHWDERPHIVKLFILVFLVPNIRRFLIEFLKNEETEETGKSSLKGGGKNE